MASKRELEDQVARLTVLVEDMRARMASLERPKRGAELEGPRSRRDILRLGGAAALGAVGAVAMRAIPAAAANNDPVLAGNANSASATTSLAGTTPLSADVLDVAAFDTDSAKLTTALGTGGQFGGAIQGKGGPSGLAVPDLRDGVDGWASGATAFGVYGLTDTGVGVTGESGTGVSVYARGTGRILQDPVPAGVPVHIPNNMEQVRDDDGTLWLSNAAGKWRRASTFEMFGNSRRVYGRGAFLAIGQKVLNVDATKKLDGSPSGVPAGVVAAWCAVQSYEACLLDIYPAGSPDPGTGSFSVMGTAGLSVQLSWMMVPLNSLGQFSFTNRKSKCRVYFDVWGYLSQSAST
jgi:hypothetical protein